MIRMSSANIFESGLNRLQERQRELANLQEQLTSGKRVVRGSDDPVAAARAERAMAQQSRAQSDQRSLEASRNTMLQAEGALGAAGEMLLKARDIMVAAGNATYSDEERRSLADAIRGLRHDLLAAANRGDGAGTHLFGGQGAQQPPFLDEPGGVNYYGAGGAPNTGGAEPLPLALDGRNIWLQAPNGVDGTPDLSIFDALDRMATELATPGRSNAQVTQGVSDGLRDIDAFARHLGAHRARAGETLNRTDAVEVRLSEQALAAAAERSTAEDLDMVQAISDFQNQQTGYDAALKAYSMVQRLSLFNYLGN